MRLRRGSLTCVAALAMIMTGCARAPEHNPGAPQDLSAFDTRAQQVAATWQAADIADAWTKGFVPVQDLTIDPGDGFPNGEMKQAYAAGWYETAVKLSGKAGTGTIHFPDGTLEVPLISAAAAYQAIDKGDATCTGCVSLEVTGATSGTVELRTSRGSAQVPAWLFSVKGLAEPIAHVAVAPEAVKPLPTPSIPEWDRLVPLVSAENVLAVKDSMIEYNLGVGACDEAIIGLVWESDRFVVIGGSVQPPGPAEVCTSQLVMHPVQVPLGKPVADRVILDAITGRPVLLG